jgi:RimJ/RimL family protein N-acetyltransferase
VLETERLRLRNWRPSDREPFAQLNADPRVMEFFPKCLIHEESDAMVDRIEEHFRVKGFGLYAAELQSDGRFIGYVGLHTPSFEAHFTPCVEIGWRLASDVWGNSLATEGARAVVRHAFENLGLDEIVSFTVPRNQRSIRVMQKIGMTHNAAEDFEHPNLPVGDPLRHHVLYRLRNPDKTESSPNRPTK